MTVSNNLKASARSDDRWIDRAAAELKAIVQVKEDADNTWKEVTKVKSVSRNGAGFTLSRPCSVGRLITLVLPLETKLRAYDQNKDLYPVMGIVQYCNAATVDEQMVYHVGVGFVGKKVPESFKNDPTQSFRIAGMNKEGLWEISEAETQFKKRKDRRYWIAIGVTISLIRQAARSVVKEETFTRNVSASGLSIACKLDAAIGDKVKIACRELDFYAVAVVRNAKKGKDDSPTLHVELIENEFPIDKLIAARTVDIRGMPAGVSSAA